MTDLRTPEEWAAEWLASVPPHTEAPLVQALLDRIDYLRTQWVRSAEAYVKAAKGEAALRRDIRGETDRYISARLDEIRTTVNAVRDAASDLQVAIDEDWR